MKNFCSLAVFAVSTVLYGIALVNGTTAHEPMSLRQLARRAKERERDKCIVQTYANWYS